MTPGDQCDLRRIHRFLETEVGEIDPILSEHLGSCPKCREYLDLRAASTACWSEARELLQQGEFDSASRADFSYGGMEARQNIENHLVPTVLESLAPTDDPEYLGRIGGYEVSGVVGVGGMGVVLKAFDQSLDRVVAIKMLAPYLASNKKARQRFSREARAAAAVLHPNVIPIHTVGETDKLPYLVMSYIRGNSLQVRLDRQGPLELEVVLRIGSQIAAGLAAAHEQGLVHRDIKPENILLEGDVERVTITDFGLARAVDDNSVTQLGTIAGTPQYMSPEQARGETVDQQSDLFSLGSVLYTMCTGQPPFRAETSLGVMRKIIDEKPPEILQLNPRVPDWLSGIVQKLMSNEKKDRFESASEVHLLLERCLGHVQNPDREAIPSEVETLACIEDATLSNRSFILRLYAASAIVLTLIAAALLTQSRFANPDKTAYASAAQQRNRIEGRANASGGRSKTSSNTHKRFFGADHNPKDKSKPQNGLSYDFSHVPRNISELVGFRPNELMRHELSKSLQAFLEMKSFNGLFNGDIQEVLVFQGGPWLAARQVILIKTTEGCSATTFLKQTLQVETINKEDESKSQILPLTDSPLSALTLDDRTFAIGAIESLNFYLTSMKSRSEGGVKLESAAADMQDGVVFGISDIGGRSAYDEANAKLSDIPEEAQLLRLMYPFWVHTDCLSFSLSLEDSTTLQVSVLTRKPTNQEPVTQTIRSMTVFFANALRSTKEDEKIELDAETVNAAITGLSNARFTEPANNLTCVDIVFPAKARHVWEFLDFLMEKYKPQHPSAMAR